MKAKINDPFTARPCRNGNTKQTPPWKTQEGETLNYATLLHDHAELLVKYERLRIKARNRKKCLRSLNRHYAERQLIITGLHAQLKAETTNIETPLDGSALQEALANVVVQAKVEHATP
jgi:hypothetical protein